VDLPTMLDTPCRRMAEDGQAGTRQRGGHPHRSQQWTSVTAPPASANGQRRIMSPGHAMAASSATVPNLRISVRRTAAARGAMPSRRMVRRRRAQILPGLEPCRNLRRSGVTAQSTPCPPAGEPAGDLGERAGNRNRASPPRPVPGGDGQIGDAPRSGRPRPRARWARHPGRRRTSRPCRDSCRLPRSRAPVSLI
jgi:hypothetical protein